MEGGLWSASRSGHFIPRERASGTHGIGGWVGPSAVLDALVKRKIPSHRRESNSRTSIVQPLVQRYTDWAITALNMLSMWKIKHIYLCVLVCAVSRPGLTVKITLSRIEVQVVLLENSFVSKRNRILKKHVSGWRKYNGNVDYVGITKEMGRTLHLSKNISRYRFFP
jgi:hypothetical protein